MSRVHLSIGGQEIEVPPGTSILDAAKEADIYIPTLCYHPDLPGAKGGEAASTVHQGEKKIENAMPGEAGKGCSRSQCSTDVPENERCCTRFGHCELQNVVNYIGISPSTPKWIPTDLPILENDPLFIRDYNLCIGCTRCVRACRELRSIGAIGFVYDEKGQVQIGTLGSTLEESGCKFCTACVEVCPTGALMDKSVRPGKRPLSLSWKRGEMDLRRYPWGMTMSKASRRQGDVSSVTCGYTWVAILLPLRGGWHLTRKMSIRSRRQRESFSSMMRNIMSWP